MKRTKTAQVFAIFALLGILLSVVGTGILVLTSPKPQETLTQEELQNILKNTKIEMGTGAEEGDNGVGAVTDGTTTTGAIIEEPGVADAGAQDGELEVK